MNSRQRNLLLALVVALGATWWAAGLDGDEVIDEHGAETPSRSSTTRRPLSGSRDTRNRRNDTAARSLAQTLAAPRPPRIALPELQRDPFAANSFQPPPPPPAAPPPPPKPVAPPLRFKYLGLLNDGSSTAVFLGDGTQIFIARTGETLLGQYRIEQITQQHMVFEYLPLKERQTLQFGNP